MKLFPAVLVRYWERRRVADSGGIDPDPTFQEKPDPIPTVKKLEMELDKEPGSGSYLS